MESLEKAKSYIEAKRKEIKKREQRITQKRFLEIGRLAYRTNISKMDDESLLGAFIELQEKAEDPANIDMWKSKAAAIRSVEEKKRMPLSVCFKETPPLEIKALLKELKFKWNSFRKEYYGYGEKSGIIDLLKNYQVEIEVIS
jgi:hypothetical protein